MQRACALALLNVGTTTIMSPGKSNDDLAALEIIQKLGAEVIKSDDSIIIKSNGIVKPASVIDCGESGLSLRMFAPIIALSDSTVEITGEGSLLKRPVRMFDEIFPLLKIDTTTSGGFLPVKLKGPLLPRDIKIDGSSSSQYLTGLLFAFASAASDKVNITVDQLKSRPYAQLSINMLKHFGYNVMHSDYEIFSIRPVARIPKDIIYKNEGDWSGAAFMLVAGAIGGDLIIKGLDPLSVQGDRAILEVLKKCKADISINGDKIIVTNANKLSAFTFDATDCPDLFPPLTALAANCEGISRIKGISRLANKESDRTKSLIDIFSKMGIKIRTEEDEMIISGGNIQSATIDGHDDHRIVMAAAIAGLKANGDVTIHGAEAVNKSYPSFFKDLQMAGGNVSLSQR